MTGGVVVPILLVWLMGTDGKGNEMMSASERFAFGWSYEARADLWCLEVTDLCAEESATVYCTSEAQCQSTLSSLIASVMAGGALFHASMML